MKVIVEFKSQEEKEAYLSAVALTMVPPSLDLQDVEKAINEQLSRMLQRFYVEGSNKRLSIEKQEEFRKAAAGFFDCTCG